MKLVIRALWLLTAGVWLAACATTPDAVNARRFEIDPARCVENISQVPTVSIPRVLPPASKSKPIAPYEFEQIAGCARSTEGNAVPVAVFQTDGRVPTEIRIVLIVRSSAAFAAAVDLLDADYRRVRTMPFADFLRRGSSYTGTLFLNAGDEAVRFLVFRPDADSVGGSYTTTSGIGQLTPYVIPIPGGVVYGSVSSGVEVTLKTWLSEVGSFSIIAADYQPAILGND